MDQLLEFFKQMSPLQLVMLAGGVIIGWPVVRDNLFKSSPSPQIVDEDDEDDEDDEIECIDDLTEIEKVETYWFLLMTSISSIPEEEKYDEVRSKLLEIGDIVFNKA